MKIVIIGLGSMGKRRLRLLIGLDLDIEIIGIDGRIDRQEEAQKVAKELGISIKTYSSIDEVLSEENITAAVISTSPLTHSSIIGQCLSHGWNVFTELNLVSDGYEENIKLAAEKNLVLYLSSTPLFRNEIRYITSRISSIQKPLNYIYHIGQYLPDWHPWENYKDFFVGNSRTNGCREILAVELPWIVRAYGPIKSVKAMSMRQTSLDIDFDDCYNLLIEHESGHRGTVTMDVVCRKAVKFFETYGEDIYIRWNGSTDGLIEYDIEQGQDKVVDLYSVVNHQNGYSDLIIENAYEAELIDFFDVLAGKKEAEYSFEKDKVILGWIDEVEHGSR